MVVLARLTTAYAAVPRVASGIRGFDITAGESPPVVWQVSVVSRRALAGVGDLPRSPLDTRIALLWCSMWRRPPVGVDIQHFSRGVRMRRERV